MNNDQTFLTACRERFRALRNVPPALGIVWESGPHVVAAGAGFRIVAALIPIAVLAVSRMIFDGIVAINNNHHGVTAGFWWLVAIEFSLVFFGAILARLIDYCDGLLADRFTRHVSIRVMEHASRLDVSCYEDPEFYDKLERARVQATDRIGMIQTIGRLLQQAVTATTLSASIFIFSPWLLLLLVAPPAESGMAMTCVLYSSLIILLSDDIYNSRWTIAVEKMYPPDGTFTLRRVPVVTTTLVLSVSTAT